MDFNVHNDVPASAERDDGRHGGRGGGICSRASAGAQRPIPAADDATAHASADAGHAAAAGPACTAPATAAVPAAALLDILPITCQQEPDVTIGGMGGSGSRVHAAPAVPAAAS